MSSNILPMKKIMLLICLFVSVMGFSQEDFIFEDYVYVTNIKSVKFNPKGQPLDMPVAYLGGGLPLVLTFDDMDNEQRDFTYEIIHCDSEWNPSQLSNFEYLEGIQQGEIQNFNPSSTTIIPYINYSLELPNRDFQWTKSGNYMLVVYEGDKEDNLPVISRRFMVVDNQLTISTDQQRIVNINHYNSHQSFDIDLELNKDVNLINPLNNVTATILQNGRWDNGVIDKSPLFEMGNKIVIDNKGTYSFPAGNEYRPLDIRSLVYGNDHIHSIDLEEGKTRVFLELDAPRTGRAYITYPDADGQFIIDNKDKDFAYSEDYTEVIFTVKSPKLKEDVYVVGAFTDWKAEDDFQMQYNEKYEAYVAVVNLKQGFYDYAYGILKNDKIDISAFDGDNNATVNKYQVFVYYRPPGSRYDQLIGFSTFKSRQL